MVVRATRGRALSRRRHSPSNTQRLTIRQSSRRAPPVVSGRAGEERPVARASFAIRPRSAAAWAEAEATNTERYDAHCSGTWRTVAIVSDKHAGKNNGGTVKTSSAVLATAIIASVAVFSPTAFASESGLNAQNVLTLPSAQVERELPNSNPAYYLVYSSVLWSKGERDKALFWFYLGQLRYKFCLASMQSGGPSCDASLFASLFEEIGSQINLYAGSNPDNYIAVINQVLDWDASHPNGYTSKTVYQSDYVKIRKGLEGLRDNIQNHKAEILAARQQNGIGENGVINGVYVDMENHKMPTNWSRLVPIASLNDLAGTYDSGIEQRGIIGSVFFPKDRRASAADTYVLAASGTTALSVTAEFHGAEIGQRIIPVKLNDGAAIFTVTTTGHDAGLVSGSSTETYYLRRNSNGELVLQRHYATDGTPLGKDMPEKLSYTFWNRAARRQATQTPSST